MTKQERAAFNAMYHELNALAACLKSDDGCPDGYEAHLSGIEAARAKARAVKDAARHRRPSVINAR